MTEERPLQSVLDRILKESQSGIDSVLSDAWSQAETLAKRSGAEDRARAETELRLAKERIDGELAQEISSSRLESKKALLEGRRRLLEELRVQILDRLADQSPSERKKMILRLVERASTVIPKGSIRCGESDEPILRELGSYRISGRVDPPGGIVVTDPTGERTLDLRLVTLVDRSIESSYEELDKLLFGEK